MSRRLRHNGEVGFTIPKNLADSAAARGREQWIASLPATLEVLAGRWALEIGEPYQPGGETAYVAPARSESFGEVVLKLACRHFEADDEAEGLREWNGEGAVRLFRAEDLDDTTTALLIERCVPGLVLKTRPEDEQDRVISELVLQLGKEPPYGARFRPLQDMCDNWAKAAEAEMTRLRPDVDAGLVALGVALFRELPGSSDREVLLATDLHAENVLAARRRPWLAVDPKPFVGDPTYEVLQHMLNCEERLMADPLALCDRVAPLAELDPQRLRLWLFARCAVELWHWPSLAGVVRALAPN